MQATIPYSKHVFLRAHKADDENNPSPAHALFVTGLPLGVATEDLLQLFSCFGTISTLALHPSQVSGILVYDQEAACSKALSAAAGGAVLELTPAEPSGATGLKGWLQGHKAAFPGTQVLQHQLDEWMEEFDAREARKLAAVADAAADDGWTVVKRHKGRQTNSDGDGISMGGISSAVAVAAGKKAEEGSRQLLPHFYRFQRREKRRDELLELREQFEADKKKVQELKAARKFKPL